MLQPCAARITRFVTREFENAAQAAAHVLRAEVASTLLAYLLAQLGTVSRRPGACRIGGGGLILSFLRLLCLLFLLRQQCRAQSSLAALGGGITFVGHPGRLVPLWVRRVIASSRGERQAAQNKQCDKRESVGHVTLLVATRAISNPVL
jgi:hypothetical protein